MSIPRVGPYTLFIQVQVSAHYRGWVVPFGNPRITASGSSPGLFAANHVLHRLWAPRHPPCTLSSLTATPPSLSGRSASQSALDLAVQTGQKCTRRYCPIHIVKEQLGRNPLRCLAPRRSILYDFPPDCQAVFSHPPPRPNRPEPQRAPRRDTGPPPRTTAPSAQRRAAAAPGREALDTRRDPSYPGAAPGGVRGRASTPKQGERG